MQFHLQTDKSQKIIASLLSSNNLHRLCSTLKLLVETLNDVCGTTSISSAPWLTHSELHRPGNAAPSPLRTPPYRETSNSDPGEEPPHTSYFEQ